MRKTAAEIAQEVLKKITTPKPDHYAALQKLFDAARKQDQSFWGWLPPVK